MALRGCLLCSLALVMCIANAGALAPLGDRQLQLADGGGAGLRSKIAKMRDGRKYTFGKLLHPSTHNSGRSWCAHLAGETLLCQSAYLNSMNQSKTRDELIHLHWAPHCSKILQNHMDCIVGESEYENKLTWLRIKRCRHGIFTFHPFDLYFHITLELYGEWSELEWKEMDHIVRPGDTVLDVGAHIGTLLIPCGNKVGETGRVIAFEPQRYLHGIVTSNVLHNGCGHCRVYNAAVGEKPGVFYVNETLSRQGQSNFGGEFVPVSDSTLTREAAMALGLGEVPIMTIDSLALDVVNFIKIDVEGMELQVLHGAINTIRKSWPALSFEIDLSISPEEEQRYIKLAGKEPVKYNTETTRFVMDELGYKCWANLVPLFNPDNFGKSDKNYFPGIQSATAFCLHPNGRPGDSVLTKHMPIATK